MPILCGVGAAGVAADAHKIGISTDDRYDVGGWETLVHRLAARCNIRVPNSRGEQLSERYTTYCVTRFDRTGDGRRMYASAMTLLERQDGDGDSYLDIAEFITDHGAQGHINGDLEQLFRRVLFNVIIGNRDDHLRNHGFIRETSGWRLSPAFDVNPSLVKVEHTLKLDDQTSAPSVDAVMATAELYRLSQQQARIILDEVREAIAPWRADARRQALPAIEIQRMETVFQV